MGLPASLRASVADAVDWALLAILAFSLLLHFGGVVWLRAMDWPRRVEVEVPAAAPPPFVRVVARPTPAPAAAVAEAAGPTPAISTRPGGRHRVRLSPEKARAALRQMIGSIGEGGHLEDRVGHARGDLDRALEGASGVSDSPHELPLRSSGSAPTIATLREMRGGEIAEGGTGAKQHESAPRGHVRAPEVPRVPGDTALAAAAADILRDGMPAIEWCYERSLRHHETLAGRLDLRIDLLPTGQVRRAYAGTDELGDSDLVACIARRVEGWRFPQSRGAILSYPLVFEPRASR
jgi:hypothetical protein